MQGVVPRAWPPQHSVPCHQRATAAGRAQQEKHFLPIGNEDKPQQKGAEVLLLLPLLQEDPSAGAESECCVLTG